MRVLFSLLLIPVVVYLAIVLLVYFGQSRLIYFPEAVPEITNTPDDIGLAYESITFTTPDDEVLRGWFVPAPAARGTVLFFHGNAGSISHRLDYLPMFQQLGYNTLLFDYRGYGQSSGIPSESGTYLDAQTAWRYLTETRNIAPAQIILFGESLGGAVAAWLATREHSGLLVLVSTFTSVPDLAAEIYPFLPVRWITRFQYNTLEMLPSIACPVFIAHSPQDEIIPFQHGQQLFQAAREPRELLLLEGGHNTGLIFMQPAWIRSLGEFMDNHLNKKS